MILPIIKYELVTEDYGPVDVSKNIVNWSEITTVMSRDGTTGVLTEVSFPIQIALRGADIITEIFNRDGLHAKATFNIYYREDHSNNYNLVKTMPLDFSSYNWDAEIVSIEGINVELNNYLNSLATTKYDIPVSEICESKQWEYNRMNLVNNGVYIMVTEPFSNNVNPNTNFILPLYLNKAEITPGSVEHDIKSQALGYGLNSDYFFMADSSIANLKVKMRFRFRASVNMGAGFLAVSAVSALTISRLDSSNNVISSRGWNMPNDIRFATRYFNVEGNIEDEFLTNMNKGDKLVFSLFNYASPDNGSTRPFYDMTITIDQFDEFTVEYITKSQLKANIDIIKPERLLQRFLDLMARGNYFKSEINWRPSDYGIFLCAAESIRAFPEAQLHGSIQDFLKWMRYIGYEYEIIGNKITYYPRDHFFQRDTVALTLTEKEVNNLVYTANTEHAYTSIKIGYQKQEYDSVNGRFEANGPFYYATDYQYRQENVLDFLIDYRADSLGIELLCYERGNFTTDTKSDNDIFIVALTEQPANYTEYTAQKIVVDPDYPTVTLFNAPLNPYFLVLYNESLIGINTKKIFFTGADMNKKAFIDNLTDDIYADRDITKKLFEPAVFGFDVGTRKLMPSPEKQNGVIEFVWRGETLRGYIREVEKNHGTEVEAFWSLWQIKD